MNPTLAATLLCASLGYRSRLVLPSPLPPGRLSATTPPSPERTHWKQFRAPAVPRRYCRRESRNSLSCSGHTAISCRTSCRYCGATGRASVGACGPGNQPPLGVPNLPLPGPPLPGRTFQPQGQSPRLSLPRHPFREDRIIWSKLNQKIQNAQTLFILTDKNWLKKNSKLECQMQEIVPQMLKHRQGRLRSPSGCPELPARHPGQIPQNGDQQNLFLITSVSDVIIPCTKSNVLITALVS